MYTGLRHVPGPGMIVGEWCWGSRLLAIVITVSYQVSATGCKPNIAIVEWPHTSSRGLEGQVRVSARALGDMVDVNLMPICE